MPSSVKKQLTVVSSQTAILTQPSPKERASLIAPIGAIEANGRISAIKFPSTKESFANIKLYGSNSILVWVLRISALSE
jgi:hypothetical protein